MSQPFVGEIRIFPYTYAPWGWALCQGQLLSIAEYTDLFAVLKTHYGGDGKSTFSLPDLRGAAPVGAGQGEGLSRYAVSQTAGVETVTLGLLPAHTHSFNADTGAGTQAASSGAMLAGAASSGLPNPALAYSSNAPNTWMSALGVSGGGQPHNNMQPYLTLNYCIALKLQPDFHIRGSDGYYGEIRAFAYRLIPEGWIPCHGQLLTINKHWTLFSLLGTAYGGDGQTTFGLPDLRGRVALSSGSQVGGATYALGQSGGEESHVLLLDEMPEHGHVLNGNNEPSGGVATPSRTTSLGVSAGPGGADLAIYSSSGAPNALAEQTIGAEGSDQGHENRMPYLAVSYCIAIEGKFPDK